MDKTDRDRILRKIKACLRLASSANEHEAAAAMRQAQKLMQQHQVSDREVLAADVQEHRAASGASMKPTDWEAGLAQVCAGAFGCNLVFLSRPSWAGKGEWLFIGCDSAPQICQFAFLVVLRQLKKARAEFIDKHLRRCKPKNRAARADEFCRGWLYAVKLNVSEFARGEQQTAAIEAHCAIQHPDLETGSARSRTPTRATNDALHGLLAGRDVRLDRPVGADQRSRALEGG